MPIYEYRCTNCGHELEALQKFTEPALIECPACHKAALAKLVSAAGFQLKGSGWYATDFRNGGKPAAKKEAAKDGTAPGGEAKTEAKSDSKGETKSEAKGETRSSPKGEGSAAPAAPAAGDGGSRSSP